MVTVTSSLLPTKTVRDAKANHCSYFTQSTMVQVESNKRDNDALKVTTALLRKSPDYYTIWNVRRTILKEGFLDNAYVHVAVVGFAT